MSRVTLFYAFFGVGADPGAVVPSGTASAAPLLAEPGWLLPWAERVAVTVTNPGQAVSDYQVAVTLGSSFHFTVAQPDGDDVRLTTGDGVTLLPTGSNAGPQVTAP